MTIIDTDTGIRALTLDEEEHVGGAGTFLVSASVLERAALQSRLTEAFKARQEDELGKAIRDRLAGFAS